MIFFKECLVVAPVRWHVRIINNKVLPAHNYYSRDDKCKLFGQWRPLLSLFRATWTPISGELQTPSDKWIIGVVPRAWNISIFKSDRQTDCIFINLKLTKCEFRYFNSLAFKGQIYWLIFNVYLQIIKKTDFPVKI